MTHEVFFVLDARFSGELGALSRRTHVWIVRSVHNDAAAKAVRDRKPEDSYPETGVSTFDGSEDEVDTLYSYLGTIDLHHGESSAIRPWDAIHVRGLSMDRVRSDRIADELGLNAVVLELEDGGFAIRRAVRRSEDPDGGSPRS